MRQGGNLVVLAQRPNDRSVTLASSQFAPYPIELSSDRITVENASVKILDPDHPLISKLNRISLKDFEGWVGERAVTLPRDWSKEYTALLESGDPGTPPIRGGLLTARYGEGTYNYVSFSFRRQLMVGNAGAYRIFANLVSLPRTTKPRPQ
jgi:hypothetical protein